jgi:hypothetical protein
MWGPTALGTGLLVAALICSGIHGKLSAVSPKTDSSFLGSLGSQDGRIGAYQLPVYGVSQVYPIFSFICWLIGRCVSAPCRHCNCVLEWRFGHGRIRGLSQASVFSSYIGPAQRVCCCGDHVGAKHNNDMIDKFLLVIYVYNIQKSKLV